MTTSTVTRLPVRPRPRAHPAPGSNSEPICEPTTAELLATIRHSQLRIEAHLPPQERIARDAVQRATAPKRVIAGPAEKAAQRRARNGSMLLFAGAVVLAVGLLTVALHRWLPIEVLR